MANTTVTFRVDEAEHRELAARAAREKVSLSDYVRVRLGLRGQGSPDDVDIEIDSRHARRLGEQIDDHEQRLRALEADHARRGDPA